MRKQGRTGNHLGNCRVRPPRKSFDIPSSTVLWQSGNVAVSTGSLFLFLFTLMVTHHFCLLSPPLMLLTSGSQCFPVHNEPIWWMGPACHNIVTRIPARQSSPWGLLRARCPWCRHHKVICNDLLGSCYVSHSILGTRDSKVTNQSSCLLLNEGKR